MDGTPALLLSCPISTTRKRGREKEGEEEEQEKKGTHQAPQSVVNNTKFCGGKYCVMLHPEAGYAAVGRPHEVVSIVLVEVAVIMLDGMSAR